MKQLPLLFALALLVPALTLVPGCGKKEADTDEDDRPKGRFSKQTGAGPGVARVELNAPLDGTITGRVVLKGDKPVMALVPQMGEHSDKSGCLAGSDTEKREQKWIVGEDNGVANVVLFLKAPAGKYFKVAEDDKKRSKRVEVDQPHCAFIPHVTAAFPSYWDGKALVPTGEKFVVMNSAPFQHNTKWQGEKTGNGNLTILPGKEVTINLVPDARPLQINCDIHSWMNAQIWAFDHPYFAVTKKDGNFTIKNVPTGVDVALVAWHEAAGFFLPGGKSGEPRKFNAGDVNKIDLSVSAK